jgi:hypothetical protein
MARSFACALAIVLAGCANGPVGEPATGFVSPQLAAAYLPLAHATSPVATARGAADIVGESKDYDLLFFRAPGAAAESFAAPRPQEAVLAYGQGEGGRLHIARGVVVASDVAVPPRCAGCAVQHAFIFQGDAGKGFSGGPVVDASDGRVLGIVFGFSDPYSDPPRRLVYAYDMTHVDAEWALVRARLPH